MPGRGASLGSLEEALGRWVVVRRANLVEIASLCDEEWTRPGDYEEGMQVDRVETPESVADVLARTWLEERTLQSPVECVLGTVPRS